MKLQIVSDLHLEFKDMVLENDGSDVLIMAGDIATSDIIFKFLEDVCSKWKWVIYVPGNHEYFNKRKSKEQLYLTLKSYEDDFPNLKILDNEVVEIEGQRFVGSTLWSSPLQESGHNDFKYIYFEEEELNEKGKPIRSKLNSYKMKEWNCESKNYLDKEVKEGDIVITHFLPKIKTFRDYHDDKNEYFGNKGLEEVMSRCKLWVSGHTHAFFDIEEECRWVCNPRGYPNEKDTGWKSLII